MLRLDGAGPLNRKRPAHWPGADLASRADQYPSYQPVAASATRPGRIIETHLGSLGEWLREGGESGL